MSKGVMTSKFHNVILHNQIVLPNYDYCETLIIILVENRMVKKYFRKFFLGITFCNQSLYNLFCKEWVWYIKGWV